MASFHKELTEAFFIDNNSEDGKKELAHTMVKCISFLHNKAEEFRFTKMLCIEVQMTPKLYMKSDHEQYLSNEGKRYDRDRVSRNFYQDLEIGDEMTAYRGLVNEGSTCYINSLLQTLYTIGLFRSSIYRLETPKEEKVPRIENGHIE